MKKRKTYEVSVINKTHSKTYSDETKFYTSDTALELNFQLKEVEYDFDSAEIILLNVDDRSLVTRPVSKSAEGFTYELEDDIVEHYGEWKGQLKFNEDGEIYVSSPVVFRIENDLSNDRPPQMTEVNTWKNLRKIADGLIDDIRSELASFEEKKLEIETAETTRQQAETQRATAESSRVSAEEQRKIDHENRSAELAGKADKVVLNNTVENGDFSQGITRWSGLNSDVSTTLNEASFIANATNGRLLQTLNIQNSGQKLYQYAHIKSTSNLTRMSMHGSNNSDFHSGSGQYEILSLVHTQYSTGSSSQFQILDGNNSGWTAIYVKNTLLINLTQTFGAGNEPTKEEMDRLIEITGYIDGEYALNNKEMLTSLMKGISEKANKKQEDWIAPTLMNGWTNQVPASYAPAGYFKDEFGIVHLRGYLTEGVSSGIFQLPVGYRPPTCLVTGVATNWYGGNNTLSIENGLVKVRPNGSNVYPTSVHLGNISFRAEG